MNWQVTTYHWHMLNERLKNLRLAKGLTLQQVGDVLGISKVSVSTWESGKTNPDGKRLEKLVDLYGTSIKYLITGVEDDLPNNDTHEKVPFCQWETIKFGFTVPKESSWITTRFISSRNSRLRVLLVTNSNPVEAKVGCFMKI